ncbi:thioredoxin family protein [Flavipsychrobacter stenotrophus]|uniref:Thioredoxin family protein n=1 Tax=Flavipsychrobacter stenotrophus TaxID=2077091 RepID=A0A2S7SY41_9BACT|nr:thioredoxin family protein [Flavipsychrobacter stenotrophus]PQJ11832.1 thioredoxin family protein [Flavipsychrobacter stenotrophus]
MKSLKYVLVCVSLLLSFSGFAQIEGPKTENGLTWYSDMTKASEVSMATHKPIFAFFTGSDWCGWCRKLQNDVFSKPEFLAWAKNNVVLVELDFPRSKKLSPELTNQNASLQQTFQVQGYPTIWMFYLKKAADKFEIDALGSVGYPQGAVQGKEQVKFLADANALLAKKKKA